MYIYIYIKDPIHDEEGSQNGLEIIHDCNEENTWRASWHRWPVSKSHVVVSSVRNKNRLYVMLSTHTD